MSDPSKYGRYYWCAKVPKTISESGEIYVHADSAEVLPNGDLLFMRGADPVNDRPPQPMLALAKGQWIAFFAASISDGSAIAVQHWEGEVQREE